jgi:hypothetical protein
MYRPLQTYRALRQAGHSRHVACQRLFGEAMYERALAGGTPTFPFTLRHELIRERELPEDEIVRWLREVKPPEGHTIDRATYNLFATLQDRHMRDCFTPRTRIAAYQVMNRLSRTAQRSLLLQI